MTTTLGDQIQMVATTYLWHQDPLINRARMQGNNSSPTFSSPSQGIKRNALQDHALSNK